ncbi:Tripartite tricarboxylate transporter TctB family [Pannonibacter phragmitetus]|uniref:Tripartite tricarboxylate transporter TctB family n=1 Tax=Pannonibacter phragmitetus TaxID=121719 RepID=A0A378ZYT9_9HYPH|nr:tripartite tricarboxylate transporter TctB family protein [Pannonibacter phragmitetus]SUB02405.1 Tripartite tricarboxylate transporter TctB family [Pannonibacter phragmitetus]
MSATRPSRLTRPETLTAIGIIIVAGALLVPALEFRPISALLPVSMLAGMIVLSLALLIKDQKNAAKGHVAKPMMVAPPRVAGAFLLITGYVVATGLIGFYLSTAITVPLVAYAFGYRSVPGLLTATLIVVGAIYAIFDFAMAQQFPVGIVWAR